MELQVINRTEGVIIGDRFHSYIVHGDSEYSVERRADEFFGKKNYEIHEWPSMKKWIAFHVKTDHVGCNVDRDFILNTIQNPESTYADMRKKVVNRDDCLRLAVEECVTMNNFHMDDPDKKRVLAELGAKWVAEYGAVRS